MKSLRVLILILSFGFCGCAGIAEFSKTIWGSSTRVLDQQRVNAITKTYEKSYWETVRASIKLLEEKGYTVFKKDEVRGVLIVMGIPGSVNTTEVGVFFVELGENQTRIELSSLSSNAKRLLAKPLFHGLDIAFGLVAADKEVSITKQKFIDMDSKGEAIFNRLLDLGDLQLTTPSEAILSKDFELIKKDIDKEFPELSEKICAILEKVQQPSDIQP